jgi:hypothetical protein
MSDMPGQDAGVASSWDHQTVRKSNKSGTDFDYYTHKEAFFGDIPVSS